MRARAASFLCAHQARADWTILRTMAAGNGRTLEPDDSSKDRGYVDVLVQALGLTGILIPAVGLGVRWVAFDLGSPVPSPMALAAAWPIAQLAETGVLALVYPVAVAIPAFFFLSTLVSARQSRERAQRTIEDVETTLQQAHEKNDRDRNVLAGDQARIAQALATADPAQIDQLQTQLNTLNEQLRQLEEHDDAEKQLAAEARKVSVVARQVEGKVPAWFTWLEKHHSVGFAGVAVTAVVAVFLLPGWPASLLPVAGLAAPFALFLILDSGSRNRQRGLNLTVVVPSLIALLLIGMFYAGLAGSGLGLAKGTYQFTDPGGSAVPADGGYVELAQDSELLYLHPCPSASSNVVSVADSVIETVTSERAGDLGAGPSLWSVLFGKSGSRIGIQYTCR